ncbi:hypothetical protein M434DRAFT_399088, partial [Hypoxylon sp. CO27-5]
MNKVLAIFNDGKLAMAPSGAYCMVGECYVDGFMHGEAISRDDGEAHSWETFRLS